MHHVVAGVHGLLCGRKLLLGTFLFSTSSSCGAFCLVWVKQTSEFLATSLGASQPRLFSVLSVYLCI